jgi:hypothetical protein
MGIQVKYPRSFCFSVTALFTALAVEVVYETPPVTPVLKSSKNFTPPGNDMEYARLVVSVSVIPQVIGP